MSAREHPATSGIHPPDAQFTHNPATETILSAPRRRPHRVPVGGDVGDWKLELLIKDFAHFIHSEVALLVARALPLPRANSPTASLERPLTPSLGVAQWTSGMPSEELLATADSALLAAKRPPRLKRAREPGATPPGPHRAGGQPPRRLQTTDRKN
jgi:hypothetical protein